jgi:hypothetical protein
MFGKRGKNLKGTYERLECSQHPPVESFFCTSYSRFKHATALCPGKFPSPANHCKTDCSFVIIHLSTILWIQWCCHRFFVRPGHAEGEDPVEGEGAHWKVEEIIPFDTKMLICLYVYLYACFWLTYFYANMLTCMHMDLVPWWEIKYLVTYLK